MSHSHSEADLAAWLRLALEPGVGPVTARLLLASFGPPSRVFDAAWFELAARIPEPLARQLAGPPSDTVKRDLDAALTWSAHAGHHVLTLMDPTYPPQLLASHDPPAVLFVAGNPELLAQPSLAIVGARNATPDGRDNAHAFARHLCVQGWSIVSGLALGIDAAAHEGALRAGGPTVAVVGTGVDVVYPRRHGALARQIETAGALVSELPLGTPALWHQFPRRNRLVAGLVRGVLVVEAAPHSGSLITARLAADLGREVFAIPGSIHSPLSRGCHALLRQGAKLVETAQDIVDELPLSRGDLPPLAGASHAANDLLAASAPVNPSSGSQTDPVLRAMGHGPISHERLLERTGLAVDQLQARLLELELSDWVDRLPGNRYQARVHRPDAA